MKRRRDSRVATRGFLCPPRGNVGMPSLFRCIDLKKIRVTKLHRLPTRVKNVVEYSRYDFSVNFEDTVVWASLQSNCVFVYFLFAIRFRAVFSQQTHGSVSAHGGGLRGNKCSDQEIWVSWC